MKNHSFSRFVSELMIVLINMCKEVQSMGVYGLSKSNWSDQIHSIQPKKVSCIGLLGGYEFQN
jgi:hypothetical protein